MAQRDKIYSPAAEDERSDSLGTAGACGCTAGPCGFTATANEDSPRGGGDEQTATPADATPPECDEDRLAAELEQTRSEVELYRDRWMRSTAEFENYKKRITREFGEVIRSANEELLKQLLPIIDNFDRALNHAGQSDESEGATEAFKKGVELMSTQFRSVLEKNGLQDIPALGEQFDPHLHEALMQRQSDEHPPGAVIEVVEQGYRLNERVLRHSKVIVSQ